MDQTLTYIVIITLTLQIVLPSTNVYVDVIYLEIYPKASYYAGSAQSVLFIRVNSILEKWSEIEKINVKVLHCT